MKSASEKLIRYLPVLIMVGAACLPDSVWELLVFDRHAIQQGQLWRLFTGHWVHCDWEHFSFNLIGLTALILVFDRLNHKQIWSSIVGGIFAVDCWIWFGEIDLIRYCGLSGVENTLFVFGLFSLWNHRQKTLAIVAGLCTVMKITMEIFQQHSLFTDVSWPPVPEAHAAGFGFGIAMILLRRALNNAQFSFNPRFKTTTH